MIKRSHGLSERPHGVEDGAALAPDAPRREHLLLAQRPRFLAFVARRLGSQEQAEEVLQAAYLRALEKGVPGGAEEDVVAWFHQVLRNAVIDVARRRSAEARGLERYGREAPDLAEPGVREEVCACLHDVLPALRPEYAEVVRQVDLEGRTLREVAAERALTVNNATVRLHRARRALQRELARTCGACATHGCLDCGCRRRPGAAAARGS